MPSFETKQKHKRAIDSLERYLKEDTERRNKLMKKGFLERFEENIVTFRQRENRISIEEKMGLQERVLSLMVKSDGSYHDMNVYSVSGGIKVFEAKDTLTTTIMGDLRNPQNHDKKLYNYLFHKKTTTGWNTVHVALSAHFRLREDKRKGGSFNLKALIAMGLLKNYSEEYPHTLKVARTKGLFTLVNNIVLEMDKPL